MADEDGSVHVVPIGRARVPSGVGTRALSLIAGGVAFWACLAGQHTLFLISMSISLLLNGVDLLMGLASQRKGEAQYRQTPPPPTAPPPTRRP
jgi:predicted phage tail protein